LVTEQHSHLEPALKFKTFNQHHVFNPLQRTTIVLSFV